MKITTTQLVQTSVTVNNSPIQDYFHPDDHAQPTYEMTPGLKKNLPKCCNSLRPSCYTGEQTGPNKTH